LNDPLDQRTLFFILGSGRMGSTFLYKMLQRHGDVALTNESRVIDALHLAYNAVSQPHGEKSHLGFDGVINEEAREEFVPIFLNHSLQALLAFYEQRFGSEFTHFGEKLPSVAAAYEFGLVWPNTRFLVLVRDPRDVVSSFLALQNVPDPTVLGTRWEEFLSQTLDDFCRVWTATYDEILDLIPEFLLIQYEDLMLKPRKILQRTMSYLELPEQEIVYAGIDKSRDNQGHGTTKSFQDSLRRWERDLSQDDAERIIELCGETWNKLCAQS
jgi:hypothetical protein